MQFLPFSALGVFQRPLTLILLQKHRDTNGSRIVIPIGAVYTTFCQEEGVLLQKYRDRNGRFIAILFKSIGGQGLLVSALQFCTGVILLSPSFSEKERSRSSAVHGCHSPQTGCHSEMKGHGSSPTAPPLWRRPSGIGTFI